MELEKITARGYSPEVVDTALIKLVLNDYNVAATCRDLKAQEIDVPERTLRDWKNRYPGRLRHHATESAPQIEESLVHKQRALASAALDATANAVEKEAERIARGDVRDTASSARSLATVAAIAQDKLLALTGRPNTIVGHERKPEAIIEQLRQFGVIESTAEEIDSELDNN